METILFFILWFLSGAAGALSMMIYDRIVYKLSIKLKDTKYILMISCGGIYSFGYAIYFIIEDIKVNHRKNKRR